MSQSSLFSNYKFIIAISAFVVFVIGTVLYFILNKKDTNKPNENKIIYNKTTYKIENDITYNDKILSDLLSRPFLYYVENTIGQCTSKTYFTVSNDGSVNLFGSVSPPNNDMTVYKFPLSLKSSNVVSIINSQNNQVQDSGMCSDCYKNNEGFRIDSNPGQTRKLDIYFQYKGTTNDPKYLKKSLTKLLSRPFLYYVENAIEQCTSKTYFTVSNDGSVNLFGSVSPPNNDMTVYKFPLSLKSANVVSIINSQNNQVQDSGICNNCYKNNEGFRIDSNPGQTRKLDIYFQCKGTTNESKYFIKSDNYFIEPGNIIKTLSDLLSRPFLYYVENTIGQCNSNTYFTVSNDNSVILYGSVSPPNNDMTVYKFPLSLKSANVVSIINNQNNQVKDSGMCSDCYKNNEGFRIDSNPGQTSKLYITFRYEGKTNDPIYFRK